MRTWIFIRYQLLIALALVYSFPLFAALADEDPELSDISKTFGNLLVNHNLSGREFDDQISQRAFDYYFNSLDPRRDTFLLADLNKFRSYERQIDDFMKEGSLEVPEKVYPLYLGRLERRLKIMREVLRTPFDFSIEERINVNFLSRGWLEEGLERERIRLDLKNEMVIQKINHPETTFDAFVKEKLESEAQSLAKKKKRTNREIVEHYLTAVALAFDAYGQYFSPESWIEWRANFTLKPKDQGTELAHVSSDVKTIRNHRVGLIHVPFFYRDFDECPQNPDTCVSVTRDVKDVLSTPPFTGVEMVVLDFRNNAGGSLREAVDLTNLFAGAGPVTQVKNKAGTENYGYPTAAALFKKPLVVLINAQTASAPEIVAAALQDRGRALIVGDDSYGKSSVQNILPVAGPLHGILDYGQIKYTFEEYYRVTGEQKVVTPDVKVPSLWAYLTRREAEEREALPKNRIDPTPFKRLSFVPRDLPKLLTQESERRRAQSDEFAQLDDDIARFKRLKETYDFSLQLETRTKERGKDVLPPDCYPLFVLKEAGKTILTPAQTENFYNTELLNISVDYLENILKESGANRS